MAPTAAQLLELRRMVAEPTDATYNDALLTVYIERYPLMDERGEQPYTWDTSTEPPTQETNTNWVESYDFHAAAADILEEKAALWLTIYSFSADGGNYQVSLAYEQLMKSVRYHRARRATKTMRAVKYPDEPEGDRMIWIGNLPEDD